MSRGTVVSRRYAKALFELAQAQGRVTETENELKLIVDVLEKDAQFRAFLNAPNITLDVKKQTLAGALGMVPCCKEAGPPLAVSLINTRVPSGLIMNHSILESPPPSK